MLFISEYLVGMLVAICCDILLQLSPVSGGRQLVLLMGNDEISSSRLAEIAFRTSEDWLAASQFDCTALLKQ